MRKIMEHMPSIKTMMTPFPYQIDASASLTDARTMMREHHVRHLPVKEAATLVGVLYRPALERAIADGRSPATAVREIDVEPAACFDLAEPVDRVLGHMAENQVECVLIVKNDKLAGIFTLTDACQCFAEFLQSIFPPKDGNDAA